MTPIDLVLVGEQRADVPSHRAIATLLTRTPNVRARWLRTDEVTRSNLEAASAIWCVPGSPYASMDGALEAIRFARENAIPFLGTCGGFQHAVIEYARNVVGVRDAEHAESAPDAATQVMVPLECALVNVEAKVTIVPGSRLAEAYRRAETLEEYQCRFGLSEPWRDRLERAGLHFTAFDAAGHVRAVELPEHPFFVGTLFQPERRALLGEQPVLVSAFFAHAGAR